MDAAVEREITPEDLLNAYCAGIFPMAESADDESVFWMDPEKRGVIPLDQFHIPASLKKVLKKRPFRVTINAAFDQVIDSCAAQTPVRGATWINPIIAGWYKELHRMGFAHSVECWKDDQLAGGLYGISIHGAFFGESMFSRVTDASKVALVHLVARLKQRDFKLLDCQFVNPHLVQFGCVEIARDDYHSALDGALSASGVSFVDSVSSVSTGSSSVESDWDSVLASSS